MAKRHHYVPVTYLNQFSDSNGFLLVYRKDPPHGPFRQKPEATGFERYYYSQVADDGTRDDDKFEQLFSQVEAYWPAIIKSLAARKPSFPDAHQLIVFLGLMRVRGPAFRDAMELHLGKTLSMQMKSLDAAGKLPPPPNGFENLLEQVQIAVDPQQSLRAMAEVLPEIGRLFGSLSYDVLHNNTKFPFLTTDNPVIYYDPKASTLARLPYTVRADGHVELLFPLTPTMLLRGRTAPVRPTIGHRLLTNGRQIRAFNRVIARYGYRVVFAREEGSEKIIDANIDVSPIVRFDNVPAPGGGQFSFSQMAFGRRTIKPKW
jgi:Protein of unknown function (DUF4238)